MTAPLNTLSVGIVLFGLSNTAQAGQIVSMPADMPHAPNGFGGWNLDNVSIVVPDGSFDPATGKLRQASGAPRLSP